MSVGTARKNENSVAALRDRPKSMPPTMVAPERDVPGISAKHCAKPTFSASSHVMDRVESTRDRDGLLSTQRITTPPTTKASATGTAWKRYALMYFEKRRPSTAAGMKATIRLR